MILELNFVTYIRMFLVIVTWHFHIRRFLPFLVIVTWHFHIWNLFSFLVGLYKIKNYLVFQIHLFRKRRNRRELQRKGASVERSLRTGGKMAVVMLQLIPSIYTNYSKNSLFISANTYEKFIVSKKNVLLATMTRCASYPIADITLL